MLNSFQHLTASLYLPPLFLGEILKQVQDDFGRFLLFLHSFWGSQFNTYVKSKNSRLMAHLRAIERLRRHQYYCTTTIVPGVWDWNSGA